MNKIAHFVGGIICGFSVGVAFACWLIQKGY